MNKPLAIFTIGLMFLAILFGVAPGADAQMRSASQDESYLEMSAEEFRNLIVRLQTLRMRRAQQIAYVHATSIQPRTLREQDIGQNSVQTPQVAPNQQASSAELRRLQEQIAQLSRQIERLAQSTQRSEPSAATRNLTTQSRLDSTRKEDLRRQREAIIDSMRFAERQSEIALLRQNQPSSDSVTRRQGIPSQADYSSRFDQLERELRQDRENYQRQLNNEQERNRRLQDELTESRRRERDDSRRRETDLDRRRTEFTQVVPVPIPAASQSVPDTVIKTVVVSKYDSMALLRRDSLNREIALLRAQLATKPMRDTVTLVRNTPIVIRDTVQKTQVVTRTVVEDRIDLAAVLFGNDSSVLDAIAIAQMNSALSAYRLDPNASLLLRGFASKSGSIAYNQALSSRRAIAVRDWLTAQGVPTSNIRVIANGIDEGTNPAQARRVEIQLLRKPSN